MTSIRRQFTPEFKLETVRLAIESTKPLTQIARDLGIRPELLYRWKTQAARREGQPSRDVFPGHGQLPAADEEVRRLQRENMVLREERDILKKATAFFAKESR